MKQNLKFQLVKFEKALAFQIIEQNKSWWQQEIRPFFKDYPTFKASNSITIKSFKCAELFAVNVKKYGKWIGLRGECCSNGKKICAMMDLYIAKKEFKSNTERDKYYNLILEALKQWSAHVYKETNREPQPFQELGNGVFVV